MSATFWDGLWNMVLLAVCAYTFGESINDQSYGWAAFSAFLGVYFAVRMAVTKEREM